MIHRSRVHVDKGVLIQCRPHDRIIGRLPDSMSPNGKNGSSTRLPASATIDRKTSLNEKFDKVSSDFPVALSSIFS